MFGVGIFSLPPPAGGLRPWLRVVFASCKGCFLRRKGWPLIVASVPRLQGHGASARPAVDRPQAPKEHGQPPIPRQQAVHQPPPGLDDLAR